MREDKGYTYGAYSSLGGYRDAGVFMAAADVNADVTVEAILETLSELERMRQAPPEAEELQCARATIGGQFIRQLGNRFLGDQSGNRPASEWIA